MEEKEYLTAEQREGLIKQYLGKPVEVVIDRPIGYVHQDMVYTVNYGYLPGVIGGDGEEQDVYVLGISEPLERFKGTVIGAIRRKDDSEDKLVAAPEGMVFTQAEIMEAVYFVEQYFDSTVDSLLRRSCGVYSFVDELEKQFVPQEEIVSGRETVSKLGALENALLPRL